MKKWTILWLSGLMGLAVGPHALSAESESTTAAAPYLLAGAPSFDQSISQFREKFNADNPKLPLNEFRSIATSRDRANLTRAASKINENLYASAPSCRLLARRKASKNCRNCWPPARASATSPIPKAPCAMWWQIMGKRA